MLILHVLQNTPVRIWVLLGGLIALGLWQTRPRTLAPARVIALPAVMGVLGVVGVLTSFGVAAVPVAAFCAGAAIAFGLGARLLPPAGATWLPGEGAFRVAGSWLPLALIVAVFMVKYAAGATLAMHPGYAGEASFAAPFAFAYGLFSGTFARRGWQILSARRPAAAALA